MKNHGHSGNYGMFMNLTQDMFAGRSSEAFFNERWAQEIKNKTRKTKDANTSGKAGAQIPHLPLGDDSSPWGR
jgi:hypothetical protein